MQRAARWQAAGVDGGEAARRLRRMKLAATVALVGAAVVWVLASVVDRGRGEVLAFVRSGAEAAMVGGLADWFAVTALFRRPLGLAIPHTALIPRKKDELATKLGEFVTGYFLTPEALQRQVGESGVVDRIGAWLADPGHAAALADDVSVAAERALASLDGRDVADYVLELLRRDQTRRSWAPVLGRLLERAVDGGATRPLVDVVAGRAREYLAGHIDELRPTVKRFIEERNWVTWLVTTDRFVNKLLRDTVSELEAVERVPDHPLRVALEELFRSVAVELQTDPGVAAGVDGVAARLLDDGRVRAAVTEIVADAVVSVRSSLAEPGGALSVRIARLIAAVGRQAVDDAGFHADIERWASDMIGHAVTRYGGELTGLIRRQVGDWPAAAASRRIELAVGRDLQYIRINGTVVGALAGVAIHAVSLLLPG